MTELCSRLGIPLDVEQAGNQLDSGNSEQAMRRLRYRFLTRLGSEHRAAIATGHTRDDRAETLLLNLFRGSGLTGLASIPRRRVSVGGEAPEAVIIRPLLDRRRSELQDWLADLGQPFRVDASNEDLDIDRNWIRRQLIPQVRQRLNPQTTDALARTADLMTDLEHWLGEDIGQRLAHVGAGTLPLELLTGVAPALRRSLVRESIRRARGSLRRIEMAHIDAALSLADGQSGRRVRIPGLWVEREFGQLGFYRPEAEPAPFEVALEVPGVTLVPEISKRISVAAVDLRRNDAEEPLLLNIPRGPLLARSRHAGDRYRLPGQREKSVKRLAERKAGPTEIPQPARVHLVRRQNHLDRGIPAQR